MGDSLNRSNQTSSRYLVGLKLTAFAVITGLSHLALAASSQQLTEVFYSLAKASSSHGLEESFFINSKFNDQLRTLQATNEAQAQAFVTKRIQFILDGVASGFVKPESLKDKATIKNKVVDLRAVMKDLTGGAIDATTALSRVAPQHSYYRNAIQGYVALRNIKAQGTWTPVPAVAKWPLVRPGQSHQLMPYARKKLANLGYVASDLDGTQLDSDLETVVRQFQLDHNLEVDGIIGTGTWSLLNRNLDQLLTVSLLSIDRLRWLPATLAKTHGFVNLAANRIEYVKNDQLEMDFKVINGRLERETPIMIDRMGYVELNPTWTVPFSIFVKDKLEAIRLDPDYIAKQQMDLIDEATKQVIDPRTIDWTTVDQTNLNYKLVQRPGPWNALGFIKFPLTNPFAIYLHDTSDRHLFKNHMRFISSGCVRLEKPFEFAETILNDPRWTADTLRAASELLPLEQMKPRKIYLKQAIPLYMMYQTAVAKADGRLIFVADTYSIDLAAYDLLRQLP